MGWISLHRKIRDHWLWEDPVKLKRWLDIVMEVNHSENKVNIGFELIQCERGQTIRSLQGWAERWGISKDSARHFLGLLQKDNMIKIENLKITTRITVLNYDIYNNTTHDKRTTSVRQANDKRTQSDPNNNVKKYKNIKNEKNIPAEFDLLFIEWFEYKDARKEKLTEIGISKFISQMLNRYQRPEMFKRAIDNSISNNYQGVFDLKVNDQQRNEQPKKEFRNYDR